MLEPDYEHYSQKELQDVLDHIDRNRYNDRYIKVKKIFESRGGIEQTSVVGFRLGEMKVFVPILFFGFVVYFLFNYLMPEDYFSSHHYKHFLVRGGTILCMLALVLVLNRVNRKQNEN